MSVEQKNVLHFTLHFEKLKMNEEVDSLLGDKCVKSLDVMVDQMGNYSNFKSN